MPAMTRDKKFLIDVKPWDTKAYKALGYKVVKDNIAYPKPHATEPATEPATEGRK